MFETVLVFSNFYLCVISFVFLHKKFLNLLEQDNFVKYFD